MPFFPGSRRSGRRRREDAGVHAVSFELDNLEFVQASDEVGLLRVGGRWIAPASRALGDMSLAVRRDTEILELAPLPDMNGVSPVASPGGEVWRGAFTMTVELAEDPRTEFALVAGDDGEVTLPRPGEWDEAQAESESESESESPVVSELVAKLEDVARLEIEPAPPSVEPQPALEPQPLLEPDLPNAELAELRAELDVQRMQLATVQAELDAERQRRAALEQELRARTSVEEDLRNAIAMREAEMASAAAQASQRARQAERRRDLAPAPVNGDHPESPRSRPADGEFLARLERARRASEAAG